jgi:hypothetical protein
LGRRKARADLRCRGVACRSPQPRGLLGPTNRARRLPRGAARRAGHRRRVQCASWREPTRTARDEVNFALLYGRAVLNAARWVGHGCEERRRGRWHEANAASCRDCPSYFYRSCAARRLSRGCRLYERQRCEFAARLGHARACRGARGASGLGAARREFFRSPTGSRAHRAVGDPGCQWAALLFGRPARGGPARSGHGQARTRHRCAGGGLGFRCGYGLCGGFCPCPRRAPTPLCHRSSRARCGLRSHARRCAELRQRFNLGANSPWTALRFGNLAGAFASLRAADRAAAGSAAGSTDRLRVVVCGRCLRGRPSKHSRFPRSGRASERALLTTHSL